MKPFSTLLLLAFSIGCAPKITSNPSDVKKENPKVTSQNNRTATANSEIISIKNTIIIPITLEEGCGEVECYFVLQGANGINESNKNHQILYSEYFVIIEKPAEQLIFTINDSYLPFLNKNKSKKVYKGFGYQRYTPRVTTQFDDFVRDLRNHVYDASFE